MDDKNAKEGSSAPLSQGGKPPPDPALIAIAEAIGRLMAQRDHAAEVERRRAADGGPD